MVSNYAVIAADVRFGAFRKYRRNAVLSALAQPVRDRRPSDHVRNVPQPDVSLSLVSQDLVSAKGDLGCLFALGLHSGRHKPAEPEMWAASLFVRDDEVIHEATGVHCGYYGAARLATAFAGAGDTSSGWLSRHGCGRTN